MDIKVKTASRDGQDCTRQHKFGPTPRSPHERLASGYIPVPESGCWLWLKCTTHDGYGRIKVGDRVVSAHRLSYELHIGEIPNELQIDHLCRVRSCVNPSHLEVVTPRENNARGFGAPKQNALKTKCKYGHPYDDENTRIVKRLNGRTQRQCKECDRATSRERWRRNHDKDAKGSI